MKKILFIALILAFAVALAGCGTQVKELGGTTKSSVITTQDVTAGDDITAGDDLTVTDDASVGGDLSVTGTIIGDSKVTAIAATSIYSTTTLTAANSGTTYSLSASGTTITLPAVTNTGANFRFAVGGALDTGNVIIASAEGDNIEGTLIVAGAVVDCDAEDFVNFVVDGENVGDYVEVMSNGTNWLIGDSGVLTSAKMTCTDPS